MKPKFEISKLFKVIAAVTISMAALSGCSNNNSAPPKKVDYTYVPEVIALVGDFGSGKIAELRVAEMVSSYHPSFVVTLGDNVYYKSGYDKLVKTYYPQTLVPAAGNHDYLMGIDNFDKFFNIDPLGRTYQYRADSGVDFFILDSTAGLGSQAIRADQKGWLIRAVASSTAQFKVVVLHHPPFSSAKHGSTKKYQWDYLGMGVDLVLSGHDHTYERLIRSGETYVVNGTGGASLYKCKPKLVPGSKTCQDKRYGAMFMYVNKHQMRVLFRDSFGATRDSFIINR